MAKAVVNPTTIYGDVGSILGLTQWVKALAMNCAMSCGVDHRCSLDLALLWLWCRPAAMAPIQPREFPYATGVAIKRKKEKVYLGCL